MKRILTVLALATIVAASGGAQASTFVAHHESPRAAVEGNDLSLHITAGSDCVVYCGWIEATLHYAGPDGEWKQVPTMRPAHEAISFSVTIPGEDIFRAQTLSRLAYWLEVGQRVCTDECVQHLVRFPDEGVFEVIIGPSA